MFRPLCLAAVVLLAAGSAVAADLVVYDDALRNGFAHNNNLLTAPMVTEGQYPAMYP